MDIYGVRDILIVLRLHYRLEGGGIGGGRPPRKIFKGLQTLLKLGLRKILKHQFFSQDPRSDPRLFQVCPVVLFLRLLGQPENLQIPIY